MGGDGQEEVHGHHEGAAGQRHERPGVEGHPGVDEPQVSQFSNDASELRSRLRQFSTAAILLVVVVHIQTRESLLLAFSHCRDGSVMQALCLYRCACCRRSSSGNCMLHLSCSMVSPAGISLTRVRRTWTDSHSTPWCCF